MKHTNVNIVSGAGDEHVQEALLMASKDAPAHDRNEAIRKVIQQLFESDFYVANPSGSRTISSKLLTQILWKVVNKMKIPDFKIYRAGPFKLSKEREIMQKEATIRSWAEQAVTAGVSTVMTEGNFIKCMRDKGGAFFKMGLFGDAHVQVGYDESNPDYPIGFRVSSLSDFYVNSSATDLRDAVAGNSADGTLEIFRYTMKQFANLFPEHADKVAPGKIPLNSSFQKQLEKSYLQEKYTDEDEIDVGYYTSIDKVQVVFAGKACTVIRKLKGDLPENEVVSDDNMNFPYVMDGKAYLPTLHFFFFPSSEEYNNYGIGHMVYDIALLAAQMDNMAYLHAVDNIHPITFVNSSNKKVSKLFSEILKAEEEVKAGGRGYVVSENPQGTSGVTVESFQSAPITQEWERAFMRLETQIKRLGFEIDAPDLGSSPNEMSIMSAQENADAPIKQIIEYNSSEIAMAVKITMDFIRKFIPDDDMTPLNTTTELDVGKDKVPVRGIPLGWVANELRKNKYFVVVNSRDGTIPSNVMELAKARETMSTLPQGTPAWNKMSIKIAKLNGHDLTEEDLGMPQMGAPAEIPEGETPTETTPINAQQLKYGKS